MTQQPSYHDEPERVRIVPSETEHGEPRIEGTPRVGRQGEPITSHSPGVRDHGMPNQAHDSLAEQVAERRQPRPPASGYEAAARRGDRQVRESGEYGDSAGAPHSGRLTAAQAAQAFTREGQDRPGEAGPHYSGDESPDEIRNDIERTRAEMSGTIDAIQGRLDAVREKMSPQHLMQEAKDKVREATVGRIEDMANRAEYQVRESGTSFVDTIKANPIPAALVAIGLGMLWRNRRSGSHEHWRGAAYDDRIWDTQGNLIGYRSDRDLSMGSHQWEPSRGPVGNVQHQASQFMGRAGDTMGGMASGAGSRMSDAADRAGSMASDAASTTAHAASSAASTIGDAAGTAARTVSHAAGDAASTVGSAASDFASGTGHQMQRARSTFGRMVEDTPLAAGALAVAAGVAIGLALPETERENEMFGEARDNLMDQAKDMAKDTQHKVQRIAGEAQRAAMDEAQNQGMTAS